MMSGCGILTNGKGTRREYCEFSLDELQVSVEHSSLAVQGSPATWATRQCPFLHEASSEEARPSGRS